MLFSPRRRRWLFVFVWFRIVIVFAGCLCLSSFLSILDFKHSITQIVHINRPMNQRLSSSRGWERGGGGWHLTRCIDRHAIRTLRAMRCRVFAAYCAWLHCYKLQYFDYIAAILLENCKALQNMILKKYTDICMISLNWIRFRFHHRVTHLSLNVITSGVKNIPIPFWEGMNLNKRKL